MQKENCQPDSFQRWFDLHLIWPLSAVVGQYHKEIRYIEWYRDFLMTIWRQHFFGVANVAKIRTPSPPLSVTEYIRIFALLLGWWQRNCIH